MKHCIRLLDLEPDKELSDRISLAMSTCLELKLAWKLEECHLAVDCRLYLPTYSRLALRQSWISGVLNLDRQAIVE